MEKNEEGMEKKEEDEKDGMENGRDYANFLGRIMWILGAYYEKMRGE